MTVATINPSASNHDAWQDGAGVMELTGSIELNAAARQEQPDAILAINLLGNPNDYDAFPLGVPVLEDNCESMGAKYRGKRCGTFGTMGTHSTFFSHHICTMEGGLITTDDVVYRDMLLALRSHGWTRHLAQDNSLGAKVDKFNFILPGYNVRPTEMQAAIGLEQLKKLDGFIAQRRENASRFPYRTQQEVVGGDIGVGHRGHRGAGVLEHRLVAVAQ